MPSLWPFYQPTLAIVLEVQIGPGRRRTTVGAILGPLAARPLKVDRRGMTGLEYALIAATVAIFVMASITTLGEALGNCLSNVVAAIPRP